MTELDDLHLFIQVLYKICILRSGKFEWTAFLWIANILKNQIVVTIHIIR